MTHNRFSRMKKRLSNSLVALLFVATQIAFPLAAAGVFVGHASADADKIQICHRTDSYSNPYNSISVDQSAADGSGGKGDHFSEHQGPIFYPSIPKHTEWGDIIPPIPGVHNGLNWTTEGQAIWNNDCNFPNGSLKVNKALDTSGGGTFVTDNTAANSLGFRWNYDDALPETLQLMGATVGSLPAGDHTVTENVADISGYNFVGWYTTNSENHNCNNPEGTTLPVTVTLKQDKTTQITLCNQHTPPPTGSITIIKDAVPNDPQDFQFTGTGTGITSPFSLDDDSDPTLSNTKTFSGLTSGSYSFSETTVSGWSLSGLVCSEGAAAQVNGATVTISLSPGQNVTCTYTNTRDTGTLNVIKHVANAHGGTSDASNFTVHVKHAGTDVAGSPAAGSEAGTSYSLPIGTYTVSEDAPIAGYAQSSLICDGQATSSVTVTKGTTKTCTITNSDIAPQLKVIKTVINNNSGTSTASDFTMNVTGTNVSSPSFPGNATGTTVTLDAGSYSVSEGAHTGYDVSYSADCNSSIAIGQTKTCTITNNDIAHPGIHVVKTGPATAHEGDTVTYTFTVTNTGDTPLSGTTVSDNIAGNAVLQSGDTNHDAILQKTETWIFTAQYKIPADQTADVVNTGTVCATDPDLTKVCDTNDHHLDVLHPAITVKKHGPLYGYEGQTIGYTFTVTNTGDTTLHNVGIDDNIANLETCADSTLAPAAFTTCTASFLIPTPQIANVVNTVTACGLDSLNKQVCNNDNHTLDVLHPGIHVVKTGPATAHEGDTVTYTFTVTNTGDIPLSSLTVKDNIASNSVYQSGDTNSNGKLDLTETWVYTAGYTIPADQTADVVNTVKACGFDPLQASIDGGTATCGTDEHHLDVLHPAINVVKSGPDNAYQGDSITYTFTVTNTGDTPLDSLTVSDNVAGNGVYQSGDTNSNGKLDLTEIWIYTAPYTVPATDSTTITNTVTACGNDSLQKNVCDTDEHNLHVYHPTITVKKIVVSSQEDNGLFNLQIDGQTAGTGGDVGDGGTTGAIGVTPGTHSVGETAGTETNLSDYVTTMSELCSEGSVTVTHDEHTVCTITNTRRASVTIVKDALPDSTQTFTFTGSLAGEESSFQLTDNGDSPDLASKTFKQLAPGIYNLTEGSVDGWDLTDISCGEDVQFNQDGSELTVTVAAGANVTCTFTNTQRAHVIVTKYNDLNRNGQLDEGEPTLPGWDMTLAHNEFCFDELFQFFDFLPIGLECDGDTSVTQTTGDDGTTTFTDVIPDQEYQLSETLQDGWHLSNIDCPSANEDERGNIVLDDNSYFLTPNPGETVNCFVGNYQDLALQITKSVDKPAPEANVVGDIVTYTLVVTNPENSGASFDTQVTDLPPSNFSYISDSWTATSNVPDHDVSADVIAGSDTGQPTYGSPGLWHLGTLLPGEVITLTYKVKIGSGVSPGTYPDLAFVSGQTQPSGGNQVFGNLQFSNTPFVGTQVAVVNQLTPTTFVAGQVLGAEILVNTGTSLLWLEFVLPVLLIGGTIVTYQSTKQGKGSK